MRHFAVAETFYVNYCAHNWISVLHLADLFRHLHFLSNYVYEWSNFAATLEEEVMESEKKRPREDTLHIFWVGVCCLDYENLTP